MKGLHRKLTWRFNSMSCGLWTVVCGLFFTLRRGGQKEKTRRFMKKDNPLDER